MPNTTSLSPQIRRPVIASSLPSRENRFEIWTRAKNDSRVSAFDFDDELRRVRQLVMEPVRQNVSRESTKQDFKMASALKSWKRRPFRVRLQCILIASTFVALVV